MFEDTKIAAWRSDEVRRLPRFVRRTRGRRPKMKDFLRRSGESCEPYHRDQVRRRATAASEKDVIVCLAVVAVQISDLDVWSIESAGQWTGIFSVELARRSWSSIF